MIRSIPNALICGWRTSCVAVTVSPVTAGAIVVKLPPRSMKFCKSASISTRPLKLFRGARITPSVAKSAAAPAASPALIAATYASTTAPGFVCVAAVGPICPRHLARPVHHRVNVDVRQSSVQRRDERIEIALQHVGRADHPAHVNAVHRRIGRPEQEGSHRPVFVGGAQVDVGLPDLRCVARQRERDRAAVVTRAEAATRRRRNRRHLRAAR